MGLIFTKVVLRAASSVQTTVADATDSGLVAWDGMFFYLPSDGRGAFSKDTTYGFDGPPFSE